MDLLSLGKNPVNATKPAGVDARYDRTFEEVQAEIDKLSSPAATEPPDWERVVRLSSRILAEQSKDLLVAGYLAVGLTKTQGIQGLAIGLRIYGDLLENFWDDLYPPMTRLRGRLAAIAWWLEKTQLALGELEPAVLPSTHIRALDGDLGRIEFFLGQHLHGPPSLEGLRTLIETIPPMKKKRERAPEAFPRHNEAEQTLTLAPPPAAESPRDFQLAEPIRLPEPTPRSAPGVLGLLRGLFKRRKKSEKAAGPTAAPSPPEVEKPTTRAAPPGAAEAIRQPRAPGAPTPVPLEKEAGPSAPVEFTVYHPQELRPQVWKTLLVYVHVQKAQFAVEADSRERLEPGVPVGQRRSAATQEIKRGAPIAVVPYLPGCLFNPPSQTLLWLEDWHRAEFRVQAAPDQPGFELGSAVNGLVSFYVGTVLVGDVKIWALLSDKEEVTASSPQTASARPYQAIFVSYSHKDTEIVTRIGRAYEALGMDFLRDQKVLRSGEEWNPQLLSLIEKADIFQLYWSEAAKSSRYVKEEWHHALAQKRENFLRPLYWKKPMPQPPRELGKLHFAYCPLE
jgi:hypothetical protein